VSDGALANVDFVKPNSERRIDAIGDHRKGFGLGQQLDSRCVAAHTLVSQRGFQLLHRGGKPLIHKGIQAAGWDTAGHKTGD
jgi:hypothetical protein